MEWNEYAALAARTAPRWTTRNERMATAALGICGEIAELREAYERDGWQVQDEAGDVCWYLALAGLTDLQLYKPPLLLVSKPKPKDFDDAFIRLFKRAGLYADAVKKHVAQGHSWTSGPPHGMLVSIAFDLQLLLAMSGIDWQETLVRNIEKLNKRYPDGFSTARSEFRED